MLSWTTSQSHLRQTNKTQEEKFQDRSVMTFGAFFWFSMSIIIRETDHKGSDNHASVNVGLSDNSSLTLVIKLNLAQTDRQLEHRSCWVTQQHS